jgi:membrane protein YqaA with SNARE-associated domain
MNEPGSRSLVRRLAVRLHASQAAAAERWRPRLERVRRARIYPVVIAALAAASTASGLYPFAPVLVAAILVAPRRWRGTYLAACLGAVVGVLALAGLVQAYGLPWVEGMFPAAGRSGTWQLYEYWARRRGWLALALFAALPLPQTPILVLSALSHVGLGWIALAVLVGKLVKYGVYAGAVLALVGAVRKRTEGSR